MREELRELFDAVVEWTNAYPCIRVAYVFGSFVRDHDLRPDSDIDLGVELVQPLTGQALIQDFERLEAESIEWRDELTRRFGHRIELHIHRFHRRP
jgi:predicted nucleotidyltransferase